MFRVPFAVAARVRGSHILGVRSVGCFKELGRCSGSVLLLEPRVAELYEVCSFGRSLRCWNFNSRSARLDLYLLRDFLRLQSLEGYVACDSSGWEGYRLFVVGPLAG